MKSRIAISILGLLILSTAAVAQSEADTVAAEVEKAIHDSLAYMREHLKVDSSRISKDGSDDFWSNGGPMRWIDPNAEANEFEQFDLTASDVKVVPLADGVAVALYYNQGSMKPKGRPAVPNYHTRVTGVYVKEDGRWKQRAIHYSPVTGAAGTSHATE